MKYNIGDEIKIREDLAIGEMYDECCFVADMEKYRGKVVTIVSIVANRYRIKESFDWYLVDEMIECKIIGG